MPYQRETIRVGHAAGVMDGIRNLVLPMRWEGTDLATGAGGYLWPPGVPSTLVNTFFLVSLPSLILPIKKINIFEKVRPSNSLEQYHVKGHLLAAPMARFGNDG